jgi:hypothetical protein
MYLATDSSKLHWGACVWNDERHMQKCQDGAWNSKILPASIFIKELTVAVFSIETLCRDHQNTKIFVLIDNTAAASVLRKLASCTHAGTELASRVDRALSRSGNSIEVLHIVSEQNPADSPSRKRRVEADRVSAMWALIDQHSRGSHVDANKRAISTSDHPIRHAEVTTETTDDAGYGSDSDSGSEWSCLSSDSDEE